MTSRRNAAASCAVAMLTVLTTAACGPTGQDAGDFAAAGEADNITRYLQDNVVTPSQTEKQQLDLVRRWLAAPTDDYVASSGRPTLRVLTDTTQGVDLVVYAYGKTPATDGAERGWGYACRRYTVDATKHLTAATIDCPSDLSRTPSS